MLAVGILTMDSEEFRTVLAEAGADWRLRGQNIWSIGEFFLAMNAALITASLTVLEFPIAGSAVADRVLASGTLAAFSVLIGLLGEYTLLMESFHWVRTGRIRKAFLSTIVDSSDQDGRRQIALEIMTGSRWPHRYVGHVDGTLNGRDVETARWGREVFLMDIHGETIPDNAVRWSLRRVLDSLLFVSISVVDLNIDLFFPSWTSSAAILTLLVLSSFLLVFIGMHCVRRPFRALHRKRPDLATEDHKVREKLASMWHSGKRWFWGSPPERLSW